MSNKRKFAGSSKIIAQTKTEMMYGNQLLIRYYSLRTSYLKEMSKKLFLYIFVKIMVSDT